MERVERTARSKLSAVMSRSHAAARGERAEWAGFDWDPRYRLKNQTIIELLEITAEEEREMRAVISDDECRRRHREKERERKREASEVESGQSQALSSQQVQEKAEQEYQ
jgi:hypothetical protein